MYVSLMIILCLQIKRSLVGHTPSFSYLTDVLLKRKPWQAGIMGVAALGSMTFFFFAWDRVAGVMVTTMSLPIVSMFT